MMKRKILAVTIPVVGCITVVGSGFSAWYFSDFTDRTESSTLNIHVTEKVDSIADALTISQTNSGEVLAGKYLILDQGGFKNADPLAGIMIANSSEVKETVKDDRTYSFKVKFDGTDSGLTLNKLYDAKMELSVTVEIDLHDKLYQYVTLVDGVSMGVKNAQTNEELELDEPPTFTDTNSDNIWTATYTLKKPSDLDEGDISQFEWTFEINLSTGADLKNSLFRYKDNKPTSGPTYTAMRKDLGLEAVGTGATLGFATTAKIGAATSN